MFMSSDSFDDKPKIFVSNKASYEYMTTVGTGSFGVVFKAKDTQTGRIVAIKRVLQDMRYKNRELQIMKTLNHTNVVKMLDTFDENTNDGVYLNLVLEYVPLDLYTYSQSLKIRNSSTYLFEIKLYMYQLFRSLAYIHSMDICHRDIKPQNLLVNPETGELRLCDFGSAKILVPSDPNVAYICSRFYRAPELIFGAIDYTVAIDIWAAGCVMSELFIGKPMFAGDNNLDQLIEILKVLGTPSQEQVKAMRSNSNGYKLPIILPTPWEKVFSSKTPKSAIDLITKLLVYIPGNRISALEACAHPFFDELRNGDTKLPNGNDLPPLFNFTTQEINIAKIKGILSSLSVKL